MNKFRIAIAIAAGAIALATPGLASATDTGSSAVDTEAVEALMDLCRSKGGDAYRTPTALVRCQGARTNKGFEPERSLCEDVIGGRFSLTTGYFKPNRALWLCYPPDGEPAA